MNALPGNVPPNSDRCSYLRNYLLACLRDNVLAKSDLLSLGLLDKLRKTLAGDLKDIAISLAAEFGIGVLGRLQRRAG